MKKLILLFLLSISITATAADETCQQSATRFATEVNTLHKKGVSISDIEKYFLQYNKELADLAVLYTRALIKTEPAKGWTKSEYASMARGFAKIVCEEKK